MKSLPGYLLLLLLITGNGCGDEETPVSGNGNVSGGIVVYGDTRTNHQDHRNVVAAIMRTEPEVVFHTGDLVENGLAPEQWVIFGRITDRMRREAEFFPAIGNHENDSDLYFDNFDLPNNERWYSVRRNGIQFLVLDSCSGIETGSEQYQWLEEQLKNSAAPYIAAVFHHPPYSTGPHGEDEMNLRESIVPLFEQYGVDVVFNGHDHAYERSLKGGVYYIVAGGGGAPLYGQQRESEYSQVFRSIHHFCLISAGTDSMVVTARDTMGVVFDRFAVAAADKE